MDDAFHPFQHKTEEWHWWYRMRRDLLDDLIVRRGRFERPEPWLLDLGCGTGGNGLVLGKHGRAVGLDRAPEALRLAEERPYTLRVRHAVSGTLPFAARAFDGAVALDVIEHLDDDEAALRELGRVVRPGGLVVIFVPAYQLLWGYNDVFSHHRRRYTRSQLVSVLSRAGLEVEESGYFNALLFPPTLAARLLQRALPSRTEGMEHQGRPGLVNSLLTRVCALERPVVDALGRSLGRGLPFGTSAYAAARVRG
jgi:SAM-dependent methyltransferase